MGDLSPYICLYEDCKRPDVQYFTMKECLRHELRVHELQNVQVPWRKVMFQAKESIICPFCGQQTAEGKGPNPRERHVGQHMEEIAFTVVPKAYEDWDFYSDSSADPSAAAEVIERPYPLPPSRDAHKCVRTNPSTGKPCSVVFSRFYDLTRHVHTIHSSRRRRIRCEHCVEEKTFSRHDVLRRHMRLVHPNIDFRAQRRRAPSPKATYADSCPSRVGA